jgi:hypothetical protein
METKCDNVEDAAEAGTADVVDVETLGDDLKRFDQP